MKLLNHSSYRIENIDNLVDALSEYSEIDVETTLLTSFLDEINDFKLDQETCGEEPPTEEEQIDYLECNYPIGELVYVVLDKIEDCNYKFIVNDEEYYVCALSIVEIKPATKEEFLEYIVDNIKEFPITETELTEAIFLKNI
jgi:hypothetical protein